jgi:hypothetical protein
MIDDATGRLFARFVRQDSTQENMKLVWSYLEKYGRPLTFYTDKASLFQTAGKRKRDVSMEVISGVALGGESRRMRWFNRSAK